MKILSALSSATLHCSTRLSNLTIFRFSFNALDCPRQQLIAAGSNINYLSLITTFHRAEVIQPICFVVVRLGRSLGRLLDSKFKRPED